MVQHCFQNTVTGLLPSLRGIAVANDCGHFRSATQSYRAVDLVSKLESLAETMQEERARDGRDPDALMGSADVLRKIRMALTALEEQLEAEKGQSPLALEVRGSYRWTSTVVNNHGTPADKEMVQKLGDQLDRYARAGDARGLFFIKEQLLDVRSRILFTQPWYFESLLSHLKQPGRRFSNSQEARTLLTQAEAAHARNDFPALRDAVNQLWNLQPPDQVQAAKDQAMRSGLKTD